MSRPFPVLTAAHQSLALAALHEITTAESIGELVEETIDHDGVATLHYECKLDGYPNWVWNVSLATLEGEEPTVMEAELLPVEGALDGTILDDDLEDLDDSDADDSEEEDDDDLDDDEDDDDDDDEEDLVSAPTHGGDIDGVDIDDLDDSADADDED